MKLKNEENVTLEFDLEDFADGIIWGLSEEIAEELASCNDPEAAHKVDEDTLNWLAKMAMKKALEDAEEDD